MNQTKKSLGDWGEEAACKYLVKKGYLILQRRWQRREGEIDIIAFDKKTNYLVFIEVKTRRNWHWGGPAEVIDYRKKEKLEKIISLYLSEKQYRAAYRLDIIVIKTRPPGKLYHFISASLA